MLYWLVVIPIIIGILNLFMSDSVSRKLIVAVQGLLIVYTSYLFYQVRSTGTIINNLGGQPRPFSITLMANELTSPLVVLTTLLFFGLVLYAYSSKIFTNRFRFLYLTLQSLIIALFLATDLFTIYVLLEVSTVVIAILIMIKKDDQAIYDGMYFLFVTVISSSFWLFGTGMLYKTFGLLDVQAIEELIVNIEDPRALILPYGMLLTAISVKIALFPLSTWLLRAYGTPSAPPVVPALLAGIYEAVGIYLFIRVTSLFSQVIELNNLFLILGIVTAIGGFLFAAAQTDLRYLLTYSTISQIGLMVIGLSLPSQDSFWGSVYHLFSHSLFKTALFLAVGNVSYFYGTRDLRQIRGVMKKIPVTGWAIILGILGITGAPLFNGSISKSLIGSQMDSAWFDILLNLISLGTILYSMKLLSILFGKSTLKDKTDTPVHTLSQWATLGFGVLTMVSGIFGQFILNFLFEVEIEMTLSDTFESFLSYLALVFLAYVIYKAIEKKNFLNSLFGSIDMSFNAMITTMVGFFVGIISYLYLLL